MAKKKTGREIVKLSSENGKFTYHTSRKRGADKLELRKYNPVTRKHEDFKEVKK